MAWKLNLFTWLLLCGVSSCTEAIRVHLLANAQQDLDTGMDDQPLGPVEAMARLNKFDIELVGVEEGVDQMETLAKTGNVGVDTLRKHLANLEARAKKIEGESVDIDMPKTHQDQVEKLEQVTQRLLLRLEALFDRLGHLKTLLAMAQLRKADADLIKIAERVAQMKAGVPAVEAGSEAVGLLRTELAELESKAQEIETKDVDAVKVLELPPKYQHQVKEFRKSLLNRLETLFPQIEGIFSLLRAKNTASKA